MTMSPARLDELVARYAELETHAVKIREDLDSIKAEIRDGCEPGQYDAAGLKVSVREPNRVFNLAKAVELLPEALRPECKLDGYDAGKVKKYLAPAVLDLVMEPGKGEKVVSIR